MARPSVPAYACSAVHSAFDVGLDSASTIGRACSRAIALSTSLVNVLGVPDTPMIACGLSNSTASSSVLTGACAWAYGFLCSAKSVRECSTNPFESTNQQCWRASSNDSPSEQSASTTKSPMPIPASPAPRKSRRISRSGVPLMRAAE